MAELSNDHRVFIILRLARYDTPSKVVAAFKAEFGIEITRQQVAGYDPTKSWNRPAAQLVRLFHKERKNYHAAKRRNIPISARDFRLQELQEHYFEAKNAGRTKLALDILEQIAKEEGGLYTREQRKGDEQPKDAAADTARKVREALFQMDASVGAAE